ncbi:hypothetical protein DFA_10176 [Cavenderia fasciculata]|uniref:Protein kinase domain-containing protein n=1 Tax=Cavenderia fasciculata TaxID=261658 RepID=F4Q9H3_CACFS|nr:uncharacterized protein DFA_10176 [Cavenderia fasciculata]EGG15342.1 hypothetical protein DFA_10176 [Cavenderia fasciculata]|eukprot:XP_004354084.1 hypothetical protein DFA_10176 [Cavenderia fasciculata]
MKTQEEDNHTHEEQQYNHIKPTISSDIWALGRLFYNLLVGPPYTSHRHSLQDGTPTEESWPSIDSSHFQVFPGTSLIDLLPPSTDLLAINLLKTIFEAHD